MQGLIAVAVIAFIAGIAVMYQLDDTNEEVIRSKLCVEFDRGLEAEDFEGTYEYLNAVWDAAFVMDDIDFTDALNDMLVGLEQDSKSQYDSGAERIIEMCS